MAGPTYRMTGFCPEADWMALASSSGCIRGRSALEEEEACAEASTAAMKRASATEQVRNLVKCAILMVSGHRNFRTSIFNAHYQCQIAGSAPYLPKDSKGNMPE